MSSGKSTSDKALRKLDATSMFNDIHGSIRQTIGKICPNTTLNEVIFNECVCLKAQAAASPILLATIEPTYFDSKQCSPSTFYWNGLVPCEVSDEANDSVLAYRLWEISEALLIDRTSSFDSYLHQGDLFSSLSKAIDTPESLSQSSSIEQVNGEHN